MGKDIESNSIYGLGYRYHNSGSQRCALILEQDMVVAEIAAGLFSSLGLSAFYTSSIDEAMSHCFSCASLELALIDFEACGMQPFRAAKLLGEINPEIKSIFTSSYPEDSDITRDIYQARDEVNSPFKDALILTKPFSIQLLRQEVLRLGAGGEELSLS